MKLFIKTIFFVFLALFLLVDCTRDDTVKIGLLMHSLNNERWENDQNFFIQKVEELGGTVEVYIAGNDAQKQLSQARELLSNEIDVLVVVPVDQFAAAQIVKDAHVKNVKVISYDRLIKNCNLDLYISTDNVEIGTLQAEYLTTLQPTGSYALIGGALNDNNSQFLYLGQMNVLQPLVERGDIEIIYNVFTERWDEEEGYNHIKKLLADAKEIDAILAGNDAIAYGVIRALREAGKEGKVKVAGMDADLKNLHEIISGYQTCTIYKPYEKMAATAAELAMTIGRTGECEKIFQTVSNGTCLVPTVFHDGVVVNKDNLKLTVISEGYQKEEEVYR